MTANNSNGSPVSPNDDAGVFDPLLQFGAKLVKLDPLIVFAALAAVISVFFWGRESGVEPAKLITVSAETQRLVVADREAILGHPIGKDQVEELMQTLVDEEVLVREAVSNGFHLIDGKVRAQLRNKMLFVLSKEVPAPTDEDLAVFRRQFPDRYMTPETVSFEHIFFKEGPEAATALLAQMPATGDIPKGTGDKFWLGRQMDRYSISQLLYVLGQDFVGSIAQHQPGEWFGPVRSGRGWHLVRIDAFHESEPLPEADVAERLRADWIAAKEKEVRRNQVDRISEAYEIVIEDRQSPDRTKQIASVLEDKK